MSETVTAIPIEPDGGARSLRGRHRVPGGRAKARVDHVVDFYCRYPGEPVTFFTRVELREPLCDLALRIGIPAGLILGQARAPREQGGRLPQLEVEGDAQVLIWPLEGELQPATQYEYQVDARVAPTYRDVHLESRAVLTDADHVVLAEETVRVAVLTKGRYLRYLPELYEQDDFMARFLMLFESFWAPIEAQTHAMPYYFEPQLTPPRLLPWLATWLGLELDPRLPEEGQRGLTRSAFSLYRQRGTKAALQKHLEIYTGGKVQIVEHRANDLRLGPETRLGFGVALGSGNRPHTFTVILHPPSDASSMGVDSSASQTKAYRRMIERLIDAEKPAHTSYALRIETAQEEGEET
jgi:phage tail-like protein